MQKITVDTGVQEYEVNGGGLLRFNPGDPNIYHRFFAAEAELAALAAELEEKAAALPRQDTAAALRLLAEYDGRIKAILSGIFGPENDFDAVLQGVNLAAVGANGQRVVQNLLAALSPILQQGAQRTVQGMADAAVAEAEAARAQRGAQA